MDSSQHVHEDGVRYEILVLMNVWVSTPKAYLASFCEAGS